MTTFGMEPDDVAGAATQVSGTADRISAGHFEYQFSTLSGAFTGATNPMTDVAAGGDNRVQQSITNAAGAVTAFSELVTSAKGTSEGLDDDNAAYIRNATPYPSVLPVDPHNKH
jgi:hypothetical protein